MVAEPASIQTLKEFTRIIPAADDLKGAFFASYGEGDRAMAVVAASLLEGALTTLILTKFPLLDDDGKKEIFERDGPLSSFSAKIKMGFAFKFYGPKTRDDLDCIREIRNAFAHARLALSFQDQKVINVCARITHLSRWRAARENPPSQISDPKGVYFLSTYLLGVSFDDLATGDTLERALKDVSNYYMVLKS